MPLQQTPLYPFCINRGARMMPFAGWEMPMQFSGLIEEHHAVRNKAGVFDISHMGVFALTGDNPKKKLQKLIPTDLNRIGPEESCYTLLLNENGGIIDDLIVYDIDDKNKETETILIVLNSACIKTDIDWLQKNLQDDNLKLTDKKKDGVFLAVQGPSSQELLEKIVNQPLSSIPRFGHRVITNSSRLKNNNDSLLISRTGYTGEDGFELLLNAQNGKIIWEKLIEQGVQPCGLGARDTLRQEAALHLYGNDINATTTPFEAGLGWLINLEMNENFIGREALEKQTPKGIKRRLVGLEIKGRAIARQGYGVFHQDSKIGTVTSGTWSPSLGKAIAQAYVPLEISDIGSTLEVEIRQQRHTATIIKKPFYRRA